MRLIGNDLHRSKDIAHVYRQGVRQLVAQGKPVAITEVGCTTYRGALDMGSAGIVKDLDDGFGQTYPDMPWEPKAAFRAVASSYGT